MKLNFFLNNRRVSINVSPEKSLLKILREDFDLTETKEGCQKGECGACLVFLNDELVNSCLIPAFRLEESRVVTCEGLLKDKGMADFVNAFSQEHIFKCGYCKSGVIMSTLALLSHTSHPTETDIIEALAGNKCDCTGYGSFIKLIQRLKHLAGGSKKKSLRKKIEPKK
jgi:carbon-monoxide dehydrogenase small subunit